MMAEVEMVAVIAYDVSRPATRRRVSAVLEEGMARVQKSVFEARMTRRQARRVFRRVEALLEEGDSARLYMITAAGLEKCRQSGGPPFPEEGPFWLL